MKTKARVWSRSRTRGQGYLEFALVLPGVLLLLAAGLGTLILLVGTHDRLERHV